MLQRFMRILLILTERIKSLLRVEAAASLTAPSPAVGKQAHDLS